MAKVDLQEKLAVHKSFLQNWNEFVSSDIELLLVELRYADTLSSGAE